MKLRMHPHMKERLSPDAEFLHKIREDTKLPVFLNQAQGTRSPDAEHNCVHRYFERLCTDEAFERSERKSLQQRTAKAVLSLTNGEAVFFGTSVSAVFAEALKVIKPAIMFGTTHEYPGLVECARTGMLDRENLLTWQMFGLDILRESANARFAGIEVMLQDPSEIEVLLRDAEKIEQKSVLLVSHVSRVDGRILPIHEIEKKIRKINKTRSANKEIILVVDGSQAIGSFEIDLSSFSGIYLFTSGKALAAEPCIGVGVGKEEKIEKMQNVISLPELDSLCRRINQTATGTVYAELKRMKEEILQMIESINRIRIAGNGLTSPYMLYFLIEGVDSYAIKKAAEAEGIEIYAEQQKYVYTKPQNARISFTPQTPWGHIEQFCRFLRDFIGKH